jgi:hypothetical protein
LTLQQAISLHAAWHCHHITNLDEREAAMRRRMILSVAVAGLVLFAIDTALAWNIQPVPSQKDRKLARYDPVAKMLKKHVTEKLVVHFTSAQHEEIAHRIFGCEGQDCRILQAGQKSAPPAVLAGSRWNDTPPFTLLKTSTEFCPVDKVITIMNYPECWGTLFRDARKQAQAGRNYGNAPLTLVLYRSHFGDMQFLHSMASGEQESARETKQKIMAWAEFLYKIALGEISRGTSIKKTGIPGIDSLFTYRYDTVQTLFVSDSPREYREDDNLHLFAMGALLHMVADSFSDSHVERGDQFGHECKNASGKRNPGWIKQFHVYNLQDSSAHSEAETDQALADKLECDTSPVDAGQAIMEYYNRKAPWEELRVYLDCVYDLANPNAPAGPGDDYEKIDRRTIEPTFTPPS